MDSNAREEALYDEAGRALPRVGRLIQAPQAGIVNGFRDNAVVGRTRYVEFEADKLSLDIEVRCDLFAPLAGVMTEMEANDALAAAVLLEDRENVRVMHGIPFAVPARPLNAFSPEELMDGGGLRAMTVHYPRCLADDEVTDIRARISYWTNVQYVLAADPPEPVLSRWDPGRMRGPGWTSLRFEVDVSKGKSSDPARRKITGMLAQWLAEGTHVYAKGPKAGQRAHGPCAPQAWVRQPLPFLIVLE